MRLLHLQVGHLAYGSSFFTCGGGTVKIWGQEENNKLNFLWPKMARWDPVLDPQNPPKKFMFICLFCVLSQEMRHINFFLGVQNREFWVGDKKFMLKKFMCFSRPLKNKSNSRTGGTVSKKVQRVLRNACLYINASLRSSAARSLAACRSAFAASLAALASHVAAVAMNVPMLAQVKLP